MSEMQESSQVFGPFRERNQSLSPIRPEIIPSKVLATESRLHKNMLRCYYPLPARGVCGGGSLMFTDCVLAEGRQQGIREG